MAKIKSQKEQQNLEWLKTKLMALCTSPKYCGLCLETNANFCQLTLEFAINDCYSTRPLSEVVNTVLSCNIEDYTISDVICEQCTEKTIQSYVFIENTKKVFNILHTCVSDVVSKTTDLNNELDDNCDYGQANVMIVVEFDNETYESINEIRSGNSTILTDKPIRKPAVNLDMVPKKDKPMVAIKSQDIDNKGPVITPTLRVVKHPRIKEIDKEVEKEKSDTKETPAVSLEGGKIVIAPLLTTAPSAPKYNTYICNSCSSIFTTYRSLKEHEKSLHNTMIFQCRFCNKKYNSQQYLDIHYVSAHSKTRCRHCRELLNNNEINSHLREKHVKQVYGCNYCDLVYYTIEQMETHFRSAHLVNESLCKDKTQCVMCFRNFRNDEIKMHKCKFSCLECSVVPCIHNSYLTSYREQVLSHASTIKCLDCDYTTKRKEHLISHVNREHLDHHPFTCDDCGTQFYTKLSLKTHIIQFHQDMKCQYCDRDFKNSILLNNHREICKGITRLHSCKECVASFNTEGELNQHTTHNHTAIVFPCRLCKREFTDESTLEAHHARVHSAIQYKKRRKFIECTMCDITFRNLKEMLQHEELHDADAMFPCKVCSKSFSSLKKVYMHKQKHYSQRTQCTGCKKLLASSYFLQHKAICSYLKEPQILSFICSICGKGFHTESSLKAHHIIHVKSIPCKLCNKLIKPPFMKKHIEMKHTYDAEKEKQLLKCNYCAYTTKKNVDFENHNNKLHLKIKPYVCTVCNKAFCGKARLDEHGKTHTDDNVCFCTQCGKKFANKVCLKMHMRRHTGEKPYACNICSERFRSSSIMKTHRLKKHQDKTIQCPLCDSMYHLVREMRFHIKKVHWRRPEPFDYKQIVPEQCYHLFEDQRLQKLGEHV